MIQKTDCFFLGTFIRTFQLNGAVVLQFDADHPDYYKNIKSLLVEMNEQLVPFFISSITINGVLAIIQFENVSDIENAETLIGDEAYLPLIELPPLQGNNFYYHEITDYTLIDELFGEVGQIKQLYDMPQQTIAQVFHDGKEVLVPLHPDFIVSIDRDKKQLHTKLPEGLVETYL